MFPTPDDIKRHALLDDMVASLRIDPATTPTDPGTEVPTAVPGTVESLNITEAYTDALPPDPPESGLLVYQKEDEGTRDLAIMTTDGRSRRVQRRLAEIAAFHWVPIAGTTTQGGFGFSPATVGTVTARTISPSSATMLQRLRRLGIVSAGTAGSTANWRHDKLSFFRGDSVTRGGFELILRVGVSAMTTTATDARMFVGFVSSDTYVAGSDTFAAGTDFFGFVAKTGAGETNWSFAHGNASARTFVATDMPRPQLNSVYEIRLLAPPGGATVFGSINDLETDDYFEISTAGSVQIPTATQGLTFQVNLHNGAAAQSVAFDLISVYAEVYGL